MAFQLLISRTFSAAILIPLLLLFQQEALAWGASGHRMISRMAIESLPAEIPAFIRTSRAIEMIGELGREPDRSRGTGNSHDHDLDPGHYINLSDDFAVGGVLPLDALPGTREDYDTALRSNGTNEYRVGFLPYAIIDGWQQLQMDFAYWRADAAAERGDQLDLPRQVVGVVGCDPVEFRQQGRRDPRRGATAYGGRSCAHSGS